MDMEDELQTDSLQARFEAMRRRKLEAAKNPRRARSQASRDALRTKFVKQVESYVGVPYSRKYSETEAPQYLDCCNLIRRCVLDLKHDFGFTIGTSVPIRHAANQAQWAGGAEAWRPHLLDSDVQRPVAFQAAKAQHGARGGVCRRRDGRGDHRFALDGPDELQRGRAPR
jgi:hypothetical protein